MKIKIISFHGLYSQGDNIDNVANGLATELFRHGHEVRVVQHDYPKLNATMGWFQWSRDIVRDYMLKCLQLEYAESPNEYTIVLTHSNATWGISRVVGKYYNSSELLKPIHVDKLVLFGSTVKRKFNWGRYPLDVINFVGTKDRVVWFSRLYKMGWSGRKGFKILSRNLRQIFRPWRHSDYALPENRKLLNFVILGGIATNKKGEVA